MSHKNHRHSSIYRHFSKHCKDTLYIRHILSLSHLEAPGKKYFSDFVSIQALFIFLI